MSSRSTGGPEERFYRRLCDGLVLVFGLCGASFVLIDAGERLVVYRVIMCLAPAALVFLTSRLLRFFPASRLLWVIRYTIPLFFLPFFFRLTGLVFPFFPPEYFDRVIRQAEGWLFGNDKLAFAFQETWPFSSPFFGELMCFSYIAYFLFIPAFVAFLIVRNVWNGPGKSAVGAWYVFCCLFGYYSHYLFFFLFPVAGPAFHIKGEVEPEPGFLINRLHYWIVSRGDVPGGAFPSSHVSVALLHVFVAAHLRLPKLSLASRVVALGICFSTVYTEAHYAVDVLGGLVSSVVCWQIIKKVDYFRKTKAAEC